MPALVLTFAQQRRPTGPAQVEDIQMKVVAIIFLGMSALACSSKPAEPAKAKSKPAVYSTDAVSQELQNGGVQLKASREQVQAFFRTHPSYHICQDADERLVAVLRKAPGQPLPDDQYVVVGYRTGKVASLDIGPPQLSSENVAGSCQ